MYIRIIFLHIYMFTCAFFSSDNDECSIGTHNCPQICTNTKGSFYCGCNTGFVLNNDGATCNGEYYMKHAHMFIQRNIICNVQKHTYITNHLDIDECIDGTHDCSQTCTNLIGSFICGCNYGYILDDDGFTCHGIPKLYIAFNIHINISV